MRAQDIARWRANLQGEVVGIAIYRAMADAEPQPALGAVYRNDDVRPFART